MAVSFVRGRRRNGQVWGHLAGRYRLPPSGLRLSRAGYPTITYRLPTAVYRLLFPARNEDSRSLHTSEAHCLIARRNPDVDVRTLD